MTDATTAAEAPPFAKGAKLCADYAKYSARAAALEAELAAAIAPLQAAADKKLAPIRAKLEALKLEAAPWWATHGVTLTKGKKKSAEHAGCVLGTRAQADKLALPAGGEDVAKAALLKARLTTLLVRTITLDKKAILARLKAETQGLLTELGFSIDTGVDAFFIEPATRTGRKA